MAESTRTPNPAIEIVPGTNGAGPAAALEGEQLRRACA
jgi:hypothetical protein